MTMALRALLGRRPSGSSSATNGSPRRRRARYSGSDSGLKAAPGAAWSAAAVEPPSAYDEDEDEDEEEEDEAPGALLLLPVLLSVPVKFGGMPRMRSVENLRRM